MSLASITGSRTIESEKYIKLNSTILGNSTPLNKNPSIDNAYNVQPSQFFSIEDQQTKKYILYGAVALGIFFLLKK